MKRFISKRAIITISLIALTCFSFFGTIAVCYLLDKPDIDNNDKISPTQGGEKSSQATDDEDVFDKIGSLEVTGGLADSDRFDGIIRIPGRQGTPALELKTPISADSLKPAGIMSSESAPAGSVNAGVICAMYYESTNYIFTFSYSNPTANAISKNDSLAGNWFCLTDIGGMKSSLKLETLINIQQDTPSAATMAANYNSVINTLGKPSALASNSDEKLDSTQSYLLYDYGDFTLYFHFAKLKSQPSVTFNYIGGKTAQSWFESTFKRWKDKPYAIIKGYKS